MSWDFPPGRRVSRLAINPQIGNTDSEIVCQGPQEGAFMMVTFFAAASPLIRSAVR